MPITINYRRLSVKGSPWGFEVTLEGVSGLRTSPDEVVTGKLFFSRYHPRGGNNYPYHTLNTLSRITFDRRAELTRESSDFTPADEKEELYERLRNQAVVFAQYSQAQLRHKGGESQEVKIINNTQPQLPLTFLERLASLWKEV